MQQVAYHSSVEENKFIYKRKSTKLKKKQHLTTRYTMQPLPLLPWPVALFHQGFFLTDWDPKEICRRWTNTRETFVAGAPAEDWAGRMPHVRWKERSSAPGPLVMTCHVDPCTALSSLLIHPHNLILSLHCFSPPQSRLLLSVSSSPQRP